MPDFPASDDFSDAAQQKRAELFAGHLKEKEGRMLRDGATAEDVRRLNQERAQLGWSPIPEEKFPPRKY